MQLLRVKKDLQFYRQFTDIIDVLRGVAASEFRRMHARKKAFNMFIERAEQIFRTIPRHLAKDKFFIKRENLPHGLIIVTTDEGFVGNLNSRVIDLAMTNFAADDEIIVLGERGSKYLEELKFPYTYFSGISDNISLREAAALTNYIISEYLTDKICSASIIWPRFVSFSIQRVETFDLLPCDFLLAGKSDMCDIRELLVEPSWGEVMQRLVRMWMLQRVYDVFWESKMSEWATRLSSLEAGHDELKNINEKLYQKYFHFLHELQDRDIREIFASKKLWNK
ncbi:MAG: FoF1 ATP synthase subunit gamma [Candidatus Omnitrophota bacterium]